MGEFVNLTQSPFSSYRKITGVSLSIEDRRILRLLGIILRLNFYEVLLFYSDKSDWIRYEKRNYLIIIIIIKKIIIKNIYIAPILFSAKRFTMLQKVLDKKQTS